jgi:hypothetical protein
MTSELRRALLAQTLALSGSVLLALGLRHRVRRWGAATSCSMWLLVPASMVAVLLPHVQATGAAPTAGAQSGMPVSAIRSVVHFSFVAGDTDSPRDLAGLGDVRVDRGSRRSLWLFPRPATCLRKEPGDTFGFTAPVALANGDLSRSDGPVTAEAHPAS